MSVEGGEEGCQALFQQMIARDFSDALYFRAHRTLVDAYCLQHPARYCASAKSLAAHLVGLAFAVEQGGAVGVAPDRLRRWLDGDPGLQKPEVPPFRGELTLAEAAAAPDAQAYAAAVERWSRSVWAAYAPLHGIARQWIARAGDAAASSSRS
jgi:hypothetical protein